jgi:hypothetical protein
MIDLIKVADGWEKQRRGNNAGTYIVAVAGGMKFLLLRKNREDPNGSTWTLFVTERTQRQDRPSRDAERGRATHEAVRETAAAAAERVFSKSDRDEHGNELADGAALWPGKAWRAGGGCRAPWPLEDHDLPGRITP